MASALPWPLRSVRLRRTPTDGSQASVEIFVVGNTRQPTNNFLASRLSAYADPSRDARLAMVGGSKLFGLQTLAARHHVRAPKCLPKTPSAERDVENRSNGLPEQRHR